MPILFCVYQANPLNIQRYYLEKLNAVAIILARGGSKGITNKNLINFCGKPLIVWTIDQALKANKLKSVWVSSDHSEILQIAEKMGANTIKRPKELCEDTSTAESGYIHAIDVIEKQYPIDVVVGLQATSPVRESKDINNAITEFEKQKCDSMFSGSIIGDWYIWEQKDSNLSSLNYNYKKRPRRQEFSEQYVENGSFYMFKPLILKKYNNRFGGKIGKSLMEFWKSFEIDEIEDVELLETIMKHYILKKSS